MAWGLTIGWGSAAVDYSQYCAFEDVSVSLSPRHGGGYMTCSLMWPVLPTKTVPRPKSLQAIRLFSTLTGETLFGGVIQSVKQRLVSAGVLQYELTCSDYTRWLDHIPVGPKGYGAPIILGDVCYTELTIDVLVKALLADWATTVGGTTSFQQPTPAVPITTNHVMPSTITKLSYQGSYQPLSQCLDELAKESYCLWFVDPDADLWFLDPDHLDLRAPLPLQAVSYFSQDTIGGRLPAMTGYLSFPLLDADADPNYFDLEITEDASNAITAVTAQNYLDVSSVEAVDSTAVNMKLVGDGQTRFFPIYNQPVDPPHTICELGTYGSAGYKLYNVSGGMDYNVPGSAHFMRNEYTDGNPNDGATEDCCYICTSNQGIRFNVAPSVGQLISVTYNYYTNGIDWQPNAVLAAEVASRENFGPGFYYMVISGSQLNSAISLREGPTPWLIQEWVALQRYSRFQFLASFSTRLPGWRPGMTFAVSSVNRGDVADNPAYNVWGATLCQRFYVTTVSMRLENDTTVLYSIEAAGDIWGR